MDQVKVFHAHARRHGPHDAANDEHVEDGADDGMKKDSPQVLHHVVVVDRVPRLKDDPWQDKEEELFAVEPEVVCRADIVQEGCA